jgi:Zn-dependent protease with chaperone function
LKKTGYRAFLFHPSFGTDVIRGEITVDDWGMRFHSDRMVEQMAMKQIHIEVDPNGRRIYFNDPARPELKIFTLDRSILKNKTLRQSDRLAEQMRAIKDRGRSTRVLGVLLYLVVGFALVVWFGSLALGAMARTVASRVPRDWEQEFGETELEKLRGEMTLVNDTNWTARVAALAAPLTRAIGEKEHDFRFHIADDPVPNAFALPGGHIIVTTGLLRLADRPEELLGVIAHEMAHETKKHGFRKVISSSRPVAMVKLFLHREDTFDLLVRNSNLEVYQSFSQEYETEADDAGWQYLLEANVDPRGMIDIFRKLKANEIKDKPANTMSREFDGYRSLDLRLARLETKKQHLPKNPSFLTLTNQVPKVGGRERGRVIIGK